MGQKLREFLGIIIVLILHFIIMSFILICVGVNIKYQLESTLGGTEYFGLVTAVYETVYFIYYSSLISFVILFLSYIFITKWIKNNKKEQKDYIK